jgi:hypothetical protein
MRVIGVGGAGDEPPLDARLQPDFPHVFGHGVLARGDAGGLELDRDTGTAVGPAAVLVCPADLFHQLLAALLKRAGTVVLPAVKAAA